MRTRPVFRPFRSPPPIQSLPLAHCVTLCLPRASASGRYAWDELLDDTALIHMNGRIYDPELGRMRSPDPFVQVPEYSQNFNRYSYVRNTTDLSGYSWFLHGHAFRQSLFKWLGRRSCDW
jgi:RHS repeat-associated protein